MEGQARQEPAMVTLDRHCGSDECGQTLETWEQCRQKPLPFWSLHSSEVSDMRCKIN